MNIYDQLKDFLADLGVEMEYQHPEHDNSYDDSAIPEISIFQSSRDHYGVFYRLDIINSRPELRILLPVEQGKAKMEMYLVQMGEHMPLNGWFSGMATFEGSSAYEKGRDAALQHLLYAVAEMMKQLFWSGDLETMSFPPEIEVCRVV